MAKPAITKRTVKGAALTYDELDTNFQNLADATISIDADGTVIALDLNDTVTLTPGTNVTFTVAGNDITIDAQGGTGLTNPLTANLDTNGYSIFNDDASGSITLDAYQLNLQSNNINLGDTTSGVGISSGSSSLTLYTNNINNGMFLTSSAIFLGNLASGTGNVYLDNNTTCRKQLFLPNYTTTQRNSLTTSSGSVIFNTTTSKFQGYDGTNWVDLH